MEPLLWGETVDSQSLEPLLLVLLRELRLHPRTILAEFSDEGLVLCIHRGFLQDLAFEELMWQRYRILLLRWFRRWSLGSEVADELTQALIVKMLFTLLRGPA